MRDTMAFEVTGTLHYDKSRGREIHRYAWYIKSLTDDGIEAFARWLAHGSPGATI